PYISYLTNKNILGKEYLKNTFGSKTVYEVAHSEPAASILNLRNKDGSWGDRQGSFNPLYKNTFWQLYFLSLLGVKKNIDGIDRGIDQVIERMQEKDGSFPSRSRQRGVLPCMQGIALEMLIRLKYADSDFTKKTVSFISDLVFKENFRCKYRQNLKCPWGAIKILRAFNLITPGRSGVDIANTKKMASDFLVRYDISKANYPRRKKRSGHWFTFGFPRGYRSDILELVSVLVDAGGNINSTNIKKSLDFIYSKKGPEDDWRLEYSLNGRMLIDIEHKNKPSKWITYMALKSLHKSNYLKSVNIWKTNTQ
ncbi:MAG: hypothetical protein MUO59_04865, partial [Actinobacteria bacterium]|nr:hypothetical protein [Actinomycetota bacterium]